MRHRRGCLSRADPDGVAGPDQQFGSSDVAAADLRAEGPRKRLQQVGDDVFFGLTVENPCPQAATNSAIRVSALDRSGLALEQRRGLGPFVPVLRPGERVGAAGWLQADQPELVEGLRAEFASFDAADPGPFAGWAKGIQLSDLTKRGPDANGKASVTATVLSDPPGARLCNPRFHLIVRDKLRSYHLRDQRVHRR